MINTTDAVAYVHWAVHFPSANATIKTDGLNIPDEIKAFIRMHHKIIDQESLNVFFKYRKQGYDYLDTIGVATPFGYAIKAGHTINEVHKKLSDIRTEVLRDKVIFLVEYEGRCEGLVDNLINEFSHIENIEVIAELVRNKQRSHAYVDNKISCEVEVIKTTTAESNVEAQALLEKSKSSIEVSVKDKLINEACEIANTLKSRLEEKGKMNNSSLVKLKRIAQKFASLSFMKKALKPFSTRINKILETLPSKGVLTPETATHLVALLNALSNPEEVRSKIDNGEEILLNIVSSIEMDVDQKETAEQPKPSVKTVKKVSKKKKVGKKASVPAEAQIPPSSKKPSGLGSYNPFG